MSSSSGKPLTKRLYADAAKAANFTALCASHNIGLQEGLDLLLDFVIINRINPEDLEYVWSKQARIELRNARNEILTVHNYTTGFLRTFENNFFQKLEKNSSDNAQRFTSILKAIQIILFKNEIEKATINEILYDLQLLIKIEDEALGSKVSKRNFDVIIAKEKEVNLKKNTNNDDGI